MTHSGPNLHEAQTVIVGVDTHKHMHVAVAIDSRGIRLGAHSFGADSEGYRALLTWAEAYGGIEAVGIEGTGGYGVGLSRTVHRAGHRVVEVNRVDRRLRRAAGKSDTIDAEAAARAVLAGQATATPKTADGAVEMMRQLKVARDSGGQSPHHRDEHAQTDPRQCATGAARALAGPHRSRARHPLCGTATGSARHARRIREAHAPGTGPSLAHPRRRNHDA